MHPVPPVRITDCGITSYPPGATLGPRVLPDYEILWIESGRCRWEFNDQALECLPGSVLLCYPGLRDRWVWNPSGATRHGYLHFEFEQPTVPELPEARTCSSDDVLPPLLRHAVWLAGLGSEESDGLAADALRHALAIFATGLMSQSGDPLTEGQHPVLVRAFRTLRYQWGDGPKVPPRISDWAGQSGVSRGHLVRVFKQHLGVTPLEVLRFLRMDHGLMLLTRTDLKVQEISDLCGFQSPFHFSRCFSQTYGVSPRKLRQQVLAGGPVPSSPMVGLRRVMRRLMNLRNQKI
ncbi:MAG: AraC family transcriptional regulator [Xanthomonadales bacterium]|nr:AraC family transcriptional regulator [Xanthomonadales bacterium]